MSEERCQHSAGDRSTSVVPFSGLVWENAPGGEESITKSQAEVDLVLSTAKVTAVEEDADTEAAIPLAMALHCNYPNPFNPETRIAFSVPASGRATVRIHNALGQPVATLYNGVAEAGQPYEVVFHAHGLGAGTYFYALEFEGRRLTRPMSLVK